MNNALREALGGSVSLAAQERPVATQDKVWGRAEVTVRSMCMVHPES